eukprot:m.70784 g.70784  ORF g.70784 m.70784 type:complete len:187 (-) comp18547_c0_seq2:14-574(-)
MLQQVTHTAHHTAAALLMSLAASPGRSIDLEGSDGQSPCIKREPQTARGKNSRGRSLPHTAHGATCRTVLGGHAGKATPPYHHDATLTKRGKRRQRGPSVDISHEVPVAFRGEGELGWDATILNYPTVELNKFLKTASLTDKQVSGLKLLRRRIKNRVYTRQARSRTESPNKSEADPLLTSNPHSN